MSKPKTQEQYEKELQDFNPNVKLMEQYINLHHKVIFHCIIHNCDYKQEPIKALCGFGCKQCLKEHLSKVKSMSQQEYVNKLKAVHKNIILIDKYVNEHTAIKHKCLIDNYEWNVTPDNLLHKQGCPVCSNKVVIKGINDMWTTNPELASMLANPEDGYIYTKTSGQQVDWICPNCDSIIKNKRINNVVFQGLSCKFCSDGISYPNKFMTHLLEQIHIDYETEKTFNWSNRKKYDFYIQSLSCIIEMNGAQHYIDVKPSNKNKFGTLQSQIENDNYKMKLAKDNGINHYIVIDARYSKLEWIKNSILNSKLCELFSLYDVNWNDCNINSLKSLVVKTSELWNQKFSIDDICNKLKLCECTIKKYISKAHELGLCGGYRS